MARLLREPQKSRAVYAREAGSLSRRANRLLRQSRAPTAYPHAFTRDHALRPRMGRVGEIRRAGNPRRLVPRDRAALIHRLSHTAALPRDCVTGRLTRISEF